MSIKYPNPNTSRSSSGIRLIESSTKLEQLAKTFANQKMTRREGT